MKSEEIKEPLTDFFCLLESPVRNKENYMKCEYVSITQVNGQVSIVYTVDIAIV